MKTNLMAKSEVKTKVKQLPYEEFMDELNELEGVTLLIGKGSKPESLQIELLAKYADLFEDFFDVAISRERLTDTSGAISLAELKKELEVEGKL